MSSREWDANYFKKDDEDELAVLGYQQQLKRNLGLLHNFGISFSIISAFSCITALFGYGLSTGGPATMTVGWIVVSFFNCFIALSMAEIASANPISGGPYFWAAMLAPPQHTALASWITGWFNLLGQVAFTTGAAFGLAEFISCTITVKYNYTSTPERSMAFCAAILISWGLVNAFGRPLLRHLLYFAIALNGLGCLSLSVALLVKAPTRQPPSFVFKTFIDKTGIGDSEGWSKRVSPAYVACCGCLLAQYTFLGYDASAHLAEETCRASRNAPIGITSSVGVSVIVGFFYLVALLFSIQDINVTIDSSYNQPVIQIIVDVFGADGAVALCSIIIMCMWHFGLFCMTSNSRMIFAFSRDGAITHFFCEVNDFFMSPVRAVGLATFLSFAIALPSLSSIVTLTAVTSIATIGILISYGIPIFIKTVYHNNFKSKIGPFYLGFISRPVSAVACIWIAFITIILCLPTINPVTSKTLNYASVAVGVVMLWGIVTWVLIRGRFVGPCKDMAFLSRPANLVIPN